MDHLFHVYTVSQRFNSQGSISWTFVSLDELPDSVTIRQVQKLARIAQPRFAFWWVWGGYHCGVSVDAEHASRSLRRIQRKARKGAWYYMRSHIDDIKGDIGRISRTIDAEFVDSYEPALLGGREDLSDV